MQSDQKLANIDTLVAQSDSETRRLRAESTGLLKEALALKEQIARSFWQLGRILRELADERRHRALGYDRFTDLVELGLDMGHSVAYRLMAVAEELDEHHATKLGVEKAYALIRYANAVGEGTSTVELLADDTHIGDRPLQALTVRELQAITRQLQKRQESETDAPPRGPVARQQALLRELRARLQSIGVNPRSVTTEDDMFVMRLTAAQVRRIIAEKD